MFTLENKTAIVTGAGSGIGRAIAILFAKRAALVRVVDRDVSGQATVDAIVSEGGRAEFASVDVADRDAVFDLAKRLPPVDVLVNNAGVGHVGTLLGTSADDLDRLLAVNVRGCFNMCKAFVPAMIERGRGSVINMASVAGVVAVRERLAYTTSKFAVVGLTKGLALDHSHTGVRFNAICPGRVETAWVQGIVEKSPDPERTRREMSESQLTGRMARPDEIAAAALYLASDESATVTGSCLMADGGWSVGK